MLAKKLLEELLVLKENDPDFDNLSVCISINAPSIGPSATESVESLRNGFDWDKGKLILNPSKPLLVDEAGAVKKEVLAATQHIQSIGEGMVKDSLVHLVLKELEKSNEVYGSTVSMNGFTIIEKSK